MHLLKAFWTQEHVRSASTTSFDLASRSAAPLPPDGPLLLLSVAPPRKARGFQFMFIWYWGTVPVIRQVVTEMQARLESSMICSLALGLRFTLVARATESEAKAVADRLVSRLTDDLATRLKRRTKTSTDR